MNKRDYKRTEFKLKLNKFRLMLMNLTVLAVINTVFPFVIYKMIMMANSIITCKFIGPDIVFMYIIALLTAILAVLLVGLYMFLNVVWIKYINWRKW